MRCECLQGREKVIKLPNGNYFKGYFTICKVLRRKHNQRNRFTDWRFCSVFWGHNQWIMLLFLHWSQNGTSLDHEKVLKLYYCKISERVNTVIFIKISHRHQTRRIHHWYLLPENRSKKKTSYDNHHWTRTWKMSQHFLCADCKILSTHPILRIINGRSPRFQWRILRKFHCRQWPWQPRYWCMK